MVDKKHMQYYQVIVPVTIEVHSLSDGLSIATTKTTVDQIVAAPYVAALVDELSSHERLVHVIFKHRVSAHIRREVLPKQGNHAPSNQPETYVEVIVEGDINSWEKIPYSL
jgi:hypothetical protein